MSHTPGPWKVGDLKPYVEVWGRMRMNAYPIVCSLEHEPREANARLIAESPTMYELLCAVDHTLSVHGKIDADTDLHKRCAEVVAKLRNNASTSKR